VIPVAAAVDLHAHTSASDGSDDPSVLVRVAAAAGLGVVAVTDHDTVAALPSAIAAGVALGVEVLPGCEMTGAADGRVVHLLLYGDGLLGRGAALLVGVARRGREERNRLIGERLGVLTGVGYLEASAVAAGASVSRAHFAGALVRRGVVADVAEAFDRYLSAGRPAYVPAPSVPIADVVALARQVGAVVILAHPGRLGAGDRERVVAAAVDAGVDGIEVWHPQHDPAVQRHWAARTAKLGLLATGGSDYHGRHKPGVRLGSGLAGNVAVPAAALAALRERLRASTSAASAGRAAQPRG
jgi:predicted metal-dependent phosphoesterase TrpH